MHQHISLVSGQVGFLRGSECWKPKSRALLAAQHWTIRAGWREPWNQTARILPMVQDESHRNVERARGALWASYALAFPDANFFSSNRCSFSVRTLWITFLGQNSRLKPQTLKLCIQTNIDILFLLVLSLIETNEFQILKIGKHVHFWKKFIDCSYFSLILVYDLALKKFAMYKKLCKAVLKL